MYHKHTLAEYIKFLELRWGSSEHDFPTSRIGHGNPYHKCKHCGRSVPEISYEGHYTGCRWLQMYRSIQGLKRVLKEEEALKSQKEHIRKYLGVNGL